MKKDGKYRFSLQFGADSEEQIRVGELLESLGNRKSAVIVAALNDYIHAHPELQSDEHRIEVKLSAAFEQHQIEALVRHIVEERLSELHMTEPGTGPSTPETSAALEADITQMLNNLDIFD